MSIRESAIPVILPPMGDVSPEVAARRSMTHWGWTAYKDIHNMSPWGIKSQIGYRERRWDKLTRCTPYPLGNLTYSEADREAAEGAAGQGITNFDIPSKELVKYAKAQADELSESYGDSGFRILHPLTGVDDRRVVERIIQVVQPFVYDIYEMRREFTEGAASRIEESDLSEDEKTKAYGVAGIMADSAGDAEKTALREYNALITSMSEAQVGRPGIAEPNEFHRWVCAQLNKPVPKRVDRMGGGDSGGGEMTTKILLDRDSEREQELRELRAEVKAMREAAANTQAAPAVETAPPAPRHDGRLMAKK